MCFLMCGEGGELSCEILADKNCFNLGLWVGGWGWVISKGWGPNEFCIFVVHLANIVVLYLSKNRPFFSIFGLILF